MIVNPGGTGSPMRAISARLAPFPPRRFLIVASPSVLAPNRYMNLFFLVLGADLAAAFLDAVLLATFLPYIFLFYVLLFLTCMLKLGDVDMNRYVKSRHPKRAKVV